MRTNKARVAVIWHLTSSFIPIKRPLFVLTMRILTYNMFMNPGDFQQLLRKLERSRIRLGCKQSIPFQVFQVVFHLSHTTLGSVHLSPGTRSCSMDNGWLLHQVRWREQMFYPLNSVDGMHQDKVHWFFIFLQKHLKYISYNHLQEVIFLFD